MARPKSENPAAVTLTVKIESVLDARLMAFCEDTGYKRSEAARVLLARGLDAPAAPASRKVAKPSPATGCPHPVSRKIGKGCAACGKPDAW